MKSTLQAVFGGVATGSGNDPVNVVLQAGKTVLTQIVSNVVAMPTVPNIEAWAMKSMSLAVQQLLLSAAAHGACTLTHDCCDDVMIASFFEFWGCVFAR